MFCCSNFMLDISQGIHDLGSIRWELALCLLLAWTIVYCALWKGIKSFGKLVYFTALFPYCILIILLVRAATLPGYMDGITFYLTPKWEKLLEINVWADACIQIFFSLGVTWGGMITLASYNQFNNNVFRDALLVGMGNCTTSFFAGFVIFGIIGYMAHELGVPVEQVAAQGAGLAFIAYPEAVSRMPISPLWSILFFLMLLSLGFGTQFSTTETVVTVLQDQFPALRGKNRKWLTLCVCSFMFLCGLSMITEGGMYVLQLVDNHSATYSALILGCLEVSVMAWVYGVDRFLEDLRFMLGFYPYPRILWKAAWMFISPMIVVVSVQIIACRILFLTHHLLFQLILIFSWINYEGSTYDGYIFPDWANVLGWCITFSSVVCVPIVAIWKICHEEGTLVARVQKLMQPSEEWGPASSQHRLPECNGGEGGSFNPGMKVGCGAQGSSVTLLTNASNSNILRGKPCPQYLPYFILLFSEYKELATTELETLNENEEEDDDDGLNMRAIRMAASARK